MQDFSALFSFLFSFGTKTFSLTPGKEAILILVFNVRGGPRQSTHGASVVFASSILKTQRGLSGSQCAHCWEGPMCYPTLSHAKLPVGICLIGSCLRGNPGQIGFKTFTSSSKLPLGEFRFKSDLLDLLPLPLLKGEPVGGLLRPPGGSSCQFLGLCLQPVGQSLGLSVLLARTLWASQRFCWSICPSDSFKCGVSPSKMFLWVTGTLQISQQGGFKKILVLFPIHLNIGRVSYGCRVGWLYLLQGYRSLLHCCSAVLAKTFPPDPLACGVDLSVTREQEHLGQQEASFSRGEFLEGASSFPRSTLVTRTSSCTLFQEKRRFVLLGCVLSCIVLL